MKNLFLSILIFCALSHSVSANNTFFQYPQAPENLTTLTQRTNYVVEHFWDNCDLKSAFSSQDKLKKAFGDYVSLMQYATLDTINISIDNLIKKVKKTPKNMLTLAYIAEETLYGDSAIFWSDELYMPFAKAVVDTKKISKAEKARFKHQTNILTNSLEGNVAPTFNYVTPSGETMTFDSIFSPTIILFFNDPDCTDCQLAKVRLATEINLNKLINAGVLTFMSIYPGEATDDWKNEVCSYPQNWVVGACDKIYDLYDMRTTPMIYFLDDKHKILKKHLNVDDILNVVRNMNL